MWYERQVSLFLLFFFVQAVKLRIIFVEFLHNEPLDLRCNGNPTHFAPRLVVFELVHSYTGGNGVHIFLVPFSGIALLFFRYRHIITLSTCVSMYYLIIPYPSTLCQCAQEPKFLCKVWLELLLKTTCVSSKILSEGKTQNPKFKMFHWNI